MLSVSPPLHRDFQARQWLCSSGDGWRSFVPPPLPTVQPAFHFLSSLLEQPILTPSIPKAKIRPPMPTSLNGSLQKMMDLPLEVLDLIAAHAVERQSGHNLALASRLFNRLSTRHLYSDVELSSHTSVLLLSQTLQDKPALGQQIKRLSFLCHRPQWFHMHKIAGVLGREGNAVSELRVRFQSSDLHEAMPFLSCFSPVSFEWVTSPCWMMRPAHLFTKFLSNWTQLQRLTFGNFRFDNVLVESVAQVPTLRFLTLKGSGNGHLDHDTLSSLLLLNANNIYQPRDKSSHDKLLELNIMDCPLANRLIIDHELSASLDVDGPALMSKLLWL